MAYTVALVLVATPTRTHNLTYTKVRRDITLSSLNISSSSATSTTAAAAALEPSNTQKFSYSRASPSVRWPHLKLTENGKSSQTQLINCPPHSIQIFEDADGADKTETNDYLKKEEETQIVESFDSNDESLEVLGRPSRTRVKKMTKLALKRAKDWRERVQFLTDRILQLQPDEFVADVLDDRIVQLTPTDFCFVMKWVGRSSWQRALEVYEWLNLRHWYSPNARMLATILAVLGKANQESLAVELFNRAEPAVGNTVQVYNAMMSVYARNGKFPKVQELLDLMRKRGCEPDLVSFNTLINARAKSGSMLAGSAIELLNEVRRSGLRPDIITYNTLISACSRGSNLEEAMKVYEDMESHNCQADIWTYNAMISVYGRCGMAKDAERLFKELGSRGFSPDAVTYNSLVYAFAREGSVEKVKEICEEMVKAGFGRDEMTYNTVIHMYGKQGQHDLASQIYKDMKSSGRSPDAVTFTVLIDSLGKANMVTEAAKVMSEMLDAGVKPTLRTFSALICGYAKAGMRVEAEETFNCMLRSGIKPDHLAYSVMLDILLRFNETKTAMTLYREMICDGLTPDQGIYQVMLHVLVKENKEEDVERVIKDMELSGMSPEIISSILVRGECYCHAANMLKLAVIQGSEPDRDNLIAILSSYKSLGRHKEAGALVDFLREHAPRSDHLITEALTIILCKDHQFEAAMEEYDKLRTFGLFNGSSAMYDSLIECCKETESFANASQLFSDMKFFGIEPSCNIYHNMVLVYCKLDFPETAHYLVDLAEESGIFFAEFVFVDLIVAYGKLKLLQKAESLVGKLRLQGSVVDRKVWNALIHAYAANGCYEQARAVFGTMVRDGPSPNVDSINGLMQALIVDGRLDELYVVIQDLQDMGFKISKSSIILMLDAFVRARNIFEVKKIYNGMKAAGYFPTMHLYRSMIELLSRGKRVRDVESMVTEMEEAGFKPDLLVYNSLLRLYSGIGEFRKTIEVYQRIQKSSGFRPDEDTYNTLILMYCRDHRPEEGLSLLQEMEKIGLDPKLDTYKSLISACGKQKLWEQAESLFEGLRSRGLKLDRSVYHIMMKMFRNSGNHIKANNVFAMMKEAGLEPSIATMHMLIVSYGSAGEPKEAENVLNNLKASGLNLTTLPYSSVIDAYLKNGDYNLGIEKLLEMKKDGLEPDHRIWTCFTRAASLCQQTSEAIFLLNSLRDSGFDLPIRILTEKSESLVNEVDHLLEQLEPLEDNAAFNFVNALEDLLWAFECRATASWVFQLAIRRHIYCHDVFRVSEKDWGADFRKLSPGAALVGLTLWLDHMQDASLQGSPESPKSVVLITGTAEYNMVSLNKTLKAYLWEMGSPFLPCKTRTGLLIAKAHSLRMWLKDSPFCLDLELKNAPSLPESNSMQLYEGYFMRSGLVPVFKEIHDQLGQVTPKKFARLALLPDDKRDKAIRADIEGRKQKLEKMKKKGRLVRPGNKFKKRKFIRRAILSDHSNVRLRGQAFGLIAK